MLGATQKLSANMNAYIGTQGRFFGLIASECAIDFEQFTFVYMNSRLKMQIDLADERFTALTPEQILDSVYKHYMHSLHSGTPPTTAEAIWVGSFYATLQVLTGLNSPQIIGLFPYTEVVAWFTPGDALGFCEVAQAKAEGLSKSRIAFENSGNAFHPAYPVTFQMDDTVYHWAEQATLAAKADAYNNKELKKRIIAATTITEVRKCGIAMSQCDPRVWDGIMVFEEYFVQRAKFEQNPELLEKLLATENDIIVYADANDVMWGSGINSSQLGMDFDLWPGMNVRGGLLMYIRSQIRAERITT